LVLTGSQQEDSQLLGPYLWSELASYCQEGFLGDDVLVSSGEHDWMTPEEAGMSGVTNEFQENLENDGMYNQNYNNETASDIDDKESDVDSEDSVHSNSIEGIRESRWYVQDDDGRSVGPYPFKDLVTWATSALLDGDTNVLSEAEGATWQPLHEVVREMEKSIADYENEISGKQREGWAAWEEVDAMKWMEDTKKEEETHQEEETYQEEETHQEEDEDEEVEEEIFGDDNWFMLDDNDQVLGPFPKFYLIEWYETGEIHGEREVCCQGDEEWMLLKTMIFQSKQQKVLGNGSQPKSRGGSWKEGLVGGRRDSLEVGPMYASNIAYGNSKYE
jgi:hypothetical protein